jgi:predicted RNase H-like HicB family nuclease
MSQYTYRTEWSPEDGEYVGLCAEFLSLSWLDPDPQEALRGIKRLVREVVADMQQNGEPVPCL